MGRLRNFWVYSLGPAVVWAIVLTLAFTIRGKEGAQPIRYVFLGYCIGWVSTTIARYVYPPPKTRGLRPHRE
jgi:ABC-type Fe3+-siderophore transport system permease subunit